MKHYYLVSFVQSGPDMLRFGSIEVAWDGPLRYGDSIELADRVAKRAEPGHRPIVQGVFELEAPHA